jgi:hypothetical protein
MQSISLARCILELDHNARIVGEVLCRISDISRISDKSLRFCKILKFQNFRNFHDLRLST